MKIAAVQTIPINGDITLNLCDHCRLAELAADNGVQLVVFPEMSLTGYEKERADELSFTVNDSRLGILKEVSTRRNIIIIAGAPIKKDDRLYIGSFILFPDNCVSIYTKQFLHSGEEPYFSSSFDCNPIVKLENEQISLAICADITNPAHPSNACMKGTTIYIASIFYTPNGIAEAYEQLSSYARQYSMNILMANYGGESYNLPSAGQSAFWANTGELVAAIEGIGEGLIILTGEYNHWTGQTIMTSTL